MSESILDSHHNQMHKNLKTRKRSLPPNETSPYLASESDLISTLIRRGSPRGDANESDAEVSSLLLLRFGEHAHESP